MVDHKNDQAIQSHRSVSGESERPMDVNAIQDVLPHGVDPSLTDAQAVADALNVDPNMGLSQAEAERRLAKFGPNELASAPPVPKWKKFLAQFRDPLVYLLLAATAISLIAWFIERANAVPGTESGEILPFDAIVIVLILIVNAAQTAKDLAEGIKSGNTAMGLIEKFGNVSAHKLKRKRRSIRTRMWNRGTVEE